MDLQLILAINVMVISALALSGSLLQRAWRGNTLWLAVNALVLVVGAALLNMAPDVAGTVVTLLFVPLVLAPIVLMRMSQSRILQQRMGEATKFARLASWFHPTARTRLNAELLQAQSAKTLEGQLKALAQLADRTEASDHPVVRATILRLRADWQGLLDLFEAQPNFGQMMTGLKVRALGETGQLDRMTRAYEDGKSRLHGADLATAQLALLTFSGRPAEVGLLLDNQLSTLDADGRRYWRAVAERAAGANEEVWKRSLEALARDATTPAVRTAAARALARSSSAPARLDDLSSVIVDECAHRINRNAPQGVASGRMTPVTWLLIAAIVIGYMIAEEEGGSENIRVLVGLGAMWPAYVIERNEWWRLASALFLHWGLLHTAINALMLLMLGSACERSFGSLRMAFIYVVGGLTSTAFVLWLTVNEYSEPAVLVGASGAIMALFGALAGHSSAVWLRYRDALDGRNLIMIAIIVVVQVTVDLAMPQVSLAAHASGMAAGLLLGIILTLLTPKRPTRQ